MAGRPGSEPFRKGNSLLKKRKIHPHAPSWVCLTDKEPPDPEGETDPEHRKTLIPIGYQGKNAGADVRAFIPMRWIPKRQVGCQEFSPRAKTERSSRVFPSCLPNSLNTMGFLTIDRQLEVQKRFPGRLWLCHDFHRELLSHQKT